MGRGGRWRCPRSFIDSAPMPRTTSATGSSPPSMPRRSAWRAAITAPFPISPRPQNLAHWRKIESAKRRLFYTLLQAASAADHQAGRSERPRLRFPGGAQGALARAPGDDRTRERPHHAQSGGGRRFRARARAPRHGRALSHAARPFPPRDRPLLLGPAGGEHAEHRGVPTNVRRRAAGLHAARCSAYYANGPAPDWPEQFVSAYASSHPWEDFAETWAHYFHMVDTLETAGEFGLRLRPKVAKGAELRR